jgi:hypothetical protein
MRTRTVAPRTPVNRRAFLRGIGTVAIGLPFLEGLPERSAWAADAPPVFSFFIMTANGVVGDRFWPGAAGPLNATAMAGKSIEVLAPYADNLLMVSGLKFPGGSASCSHAQGCVQTLTGTAPGSAGNGSTSGGPSVDMVISRALNPSGTDPLNLYAGGQKGAYIAERASFTAGGTAARAAQLNPYETYKKLIGLTADTPVTVPTEPGTGIPPTGPSAADEVLIRQKSVNDLVRDEFKALLGSSKLSTEDLRRLTNHMDGIRQLEENMVSTGEMMNEMNADQPDTVVGGNTCTETGLNMTGLDAFKNGVTFNNKGHMIEDIVMLHGETVALAFACNLNRTAVLQWGDGTDPTAYNTQATGAYNQFHKISHRTNSDAASGGDAWAKDAHAEIDVIRMTSFAHIVKHFKDRGLLDTSYVYWTSSVSDGPSHSFQNLPIIIAGNGGGFLKQGQYVKASGNNSALFASLLTAAGVPTENFGAGGGQLTAVHA